MIPDTGLGIATASTIPFRPARKAGTLIANGSTCGQSIQGADHPHGTAIDHMGVNHGRLDIGVPEQLLRSANILAGFQQVGGKRVPQGI